MGGCESDAERRSLAGEARVVLDGHRKRDGGLGDIGDVEEQRAGGLGTRHALALARGNVLNGRRLEPSHSPEFKMFFAILDVLRSWGLRPFRTELCLFHCGLCLAGQAEAFLVDEERSIAILDWKKRRQFVSITASRASPSLLSTCHTLTAGCTACSSMFISGWSKQSLAYAYLECISAKSIRAWREPC